MSTGTPATPHCNCGHQMKPAVSTPDIFFCPLCDVPQEPKRKASNVD